jgi:hypothetical protein
MNWTGLVVSVYTFTLCTFVLQVKVYLDSPVRELSAMPNADAALVNRSIPLHFLTAGR